MLRRTFIASAVLLATAAAAPSAFAFTEGKDADYITLEKPLAGGEGKLVKVWSYDCPFCFKFDVGVDPKAIPAAEKATGLKFDMYHLETKGKYGRAGTELFAWCMLRDKAAGVTDWEDPKSLFKKAKDAIYLAYHRKGERWTAGEEAFLKTGLDAIGAKPEEFAAARKTPGRQLEAQLRRGEDPGHPGLRGQRQVPHHDEGHPLRSGLRRPHCRTLQEVIRLEFFRK